MISEEPEMHPIGVEITLPEWIEHFLKRSPGVFPTPEERMRLVVELARENIGHRTGGPFGAGIFDREGRLIAPGVNLVQAGNCSVLHAEIVAIILAQKRLGRFDIGDSGKYFYELAASTEPCAMCFGAIPWSGVARVVCGARDADARSIGFDEGPKLPDWQGALQSRGIEVKRDVLRDDAAAVLDRYRRMGGMIYNTGKSDNTEER
jgi:tRNA(Arg) A34 adenosine deaminase TadA